MILMYHNIGPETDFDTLSEAYFLAHLQSLKERKLKVVDMGTYVDQLEKGKTISEEVAITFDDAFISIQQIVLPLMRQFQYPFTVFVPVDHVGGHNAWDAKGHPKPLRIMDWEQIREVGQDPLVTLGSHSLSHRSMGTLPAAEVEKELAESRKKMKAELGKASSTMSTTQIDFFAFPYGQKKDLGGATAELFRKLGYRAACSTNWKRNNSPAEQFRLNRIEINQTDDRSVFEQKLTRNPDLRALKQRVKNLLKG